MVLQLRPVFLLMINLIMNLKKELTKKDIPTDFNQF